MSILTIQNILDLLLKNLVNNKKSIRLLGLGVNFDNSVNDQLILISHKLH